MNGHERRKSTDEALNRHKGVPILDSSAISPHVVDLSAFSNHTPKGPRPNLDVWQKLSAWARVFKGPDHSHRSMVPFMPHKKLRHASLRGFLKLPFAIMALPFKKNLEPLKAAAPAAAPLPPKPADRNTSGPAPITIKLSKKRTAGFSFFPDASWKRQVVSFAALAILVTLPLQALLSYAGLLRHAGVITADAQEAVHSLKNASESALNSNDSSANTFARSASAFATTRERVDNAAIQLAALLSGNGEKLSSGTKLLNAGEAIAKAGVELAAGLDAMQASQDTNAVKIARMSDALAAALPHLENGVEQLDGVSERSVPAAYRAAFSRIREDAGAALADLKRTSNASPTLLDAIGASEKRRYLVVFQNANELRPTGGFIGSYALIDLEDGAISNMEIPAGGSYDLRGGFNRRIMAPDPLRLVNTRWEFQDANWFPDFPTSARSLMWFYEKSGGPTVDGVIAITSNVMQELLRAAGPIEMPEYGKTITAENFALETQKAVEIEYDRETNRPKQIISDMAPRLLKKLVDGGSNDLSKLAGSLGRALEAKDIQVYLREERAQAVADSFGWTGALRPVPNADYLAVIDTNIAGGKTDGVIKEHIRHETRFEENGDIIDTVTVTRTHEGKAGELFTGIKNIDYMRVYVPKGSTLLTAEGFRAPADGYFLPQDTTLQPSAMLAAVEGPARVDDVSKTSIHDETGLTVFGNWIQLEPGETKTVILSYRLPFRLDDLTRKPESWQDRLKAALGASVATTEFKLIVQKQAGATRREFESRLLAPNGWSIRTSVPEEAKVAEGRLELARRLDQDIFIGTVLVNRE